VSDPAVERQALPWLKGVVLPLALLLAFLFSGPLQVPTADLDHNPVVRVWKLRILLLVVPALLLASWSWGGFLRRRKLFPGFFRVASDRKWLFAAALVGLILFAIFSTTLFERMPRVWDTAGYLFQAKILASGRMAAPAPPSPEHFWLYPLVVWQGKWFAIYPLGHSSLLALGVLAGAPWLVCPLIGALSLLLTGLFTGEVLGRRATPLAGLLFLLSPFAIFMSSSFQGHNSNLLGSALFLYCYARAHNRKGTLSPILAGLGLGFSFFVRTLSAAALAAPFVLFELWLLLRTRGEARRRALVRGVLIYIGFAPFIAATLIQNTAHTGSPTLMAYRIKFPTQTVGLKADGMVEPGRHGEDFSHTPQNALRNLRSRGLLMASDLFGWPYLCFVPALAALALRRRQLLHPGERKDTEPRKPPWLLLAAGVCLAYAGAYSLFWNPGYGFGARYYYGMLPAVVLLTVAGFRSLAGRPTEDFGRFNRTVLGVTALLLINLALYLPMRYRQFDHQQQYNTVDANLAEMVEEAGIEEGLVFVESWFLGYYNYSSALPLNAPDLSGNVFARDLDDAADDALMAALPEKHPYGFRFDEATGTLLLTDRATGETILARPAAPGQTRYPSGADPEAQEDYWKQRRGTLGTWGL